MFEITPAKRRELRAQAHHLDPVVSVSANGLSDSVMKEIELSLKVHELIKIRVYGDDREARTAMLETICTTLNCAAVQHIGKLLVVFRYNPELHIPKSAPTRSRTRDPSAVFGAKAEPRRPGSRSTVGTSAARRLTKARRDPATARYRMASLRRSKPQD